MQPLRVYLSIWDRLCLYAYGLSFFGLSLYLMIKWGHLLFALFFLSVLVQMVVIFFRTRPLEMSDETIRYSTALSFSEMRWDEVRRIEVKDRVVLCGEKKRLALPSMQNMKGADKAQMLDLFHRQIAAREIPVVKKGRFAVLRWQDWAVEPDAATLLRVEFPRWVRRLPFAIAAFALGLLLIHWCFGGETVLAPLAIFLITFAIVLLFMRGPLEMNDQIIRQVTPLGRIYLAWDDLQSIHLGDTILLKFEPKRILLPDLEKCEGADKEAMIKLFEAQVAARGITVTRKRGAR